MTRSEIVWALISTLVAFAVFMAAFWAARDVAFIWNDDLPWEFAGAFSYGGKLQTEGRWLVFLWHWAFGIWPRLPSYYLGVLCWCFTSGLVAVRLFGPGKACLAVPAAIALVANPFVTWLVLWPHTVLPMMVALFASVAGLVLQRPGGRRFYAVLAAGMVVIMLSYQLFALLLFGYAVLILLVRRSETPAGPFAALAICAAVSALAMWAGVMAAYALNWWVFGHFSLNPAAWRFNEMPAFDSRFELAWLDLGAIAAHLRNVCGAAFPLLLGLAVAGLAVSVVRGRRRRRAGGRRFLLLVALATVGLAVLPAAVPLVSGVPSPADRGGGTLWLALLCPVFIGAALAPATWPRAGLLAGAVLCLWPLGAIGGQISTWSAQARQNELVLARIATDLDAFGGLAGRPLILLGEPLAIKGPAAQYKTMLKRRFKVYFKGQIEDVTMCRTIRDCAIPDGWRNAAMMAPAYPLPGYLVAAKDVVIVRLGP
jgi:hypothetical protein